MFAEIVVNTHQDPAKKFFTYRIPKELERGVNLGSEVLVPFGKRSVEGYVFEIKTTRPPFPTKEIKGLRGKAFTAAQVKLARWMSAYYAAPPLDCLKCQLPGRGQRYSEGKENEVETLLLVPYAVQVRIKALELNRAERRTTLIGSRSVVFAPLPKLKRIIIEEPENWTYKDERSPYYHAKDVAQKRAELEGLKLELRYLVPRAEDALPLRALPTLPSPIKIIDLQKERDTGNPPAGGHGFSQLSIEAVKAFRQMGSSDAGLVFVNSREAKEKIRQAVKEQNLDANKIEIAGAEIFGQAGKKYAAVVVSDTDTLFNLPDFRSHEKLLLIITKLAQLTKGDVFLQTANATHPLFEELETGNLKGFYERELQDRKPLMYPPFGALAKLEFSAKTTAKVESEAQRLYKKLLTNQLPTIFVSPPYPPYAKTRGRVQLNIAVKARSRRELGKALTLVPSSWKIIIDPESLL